MTASEKELGLDEIGMGNFLAQYPPGKPANVQAEVVPPDMVEENSDLETPDIRLWCQECATLLYFECVHVACNGAVPGDRSLPAEKVLRYRCRNCARTEKIFGIRVKRVSSDKLWIMKFGQDPLFDDPIPTKTRELVGDDQELFNKGRQCEVQGLGIGAAGYYRRIVENQWRRLVRKILDVARKTGAKSEIVSALEKAEKETQFQKAVDAVKDELPGVLWINGKNPLKALHRALSQNLHERADKEALDRGRDIRLILIELGERIGEALKDKKEVESAINRLDQADYSNRNEN